MNNVEKLWKTLRISREKVEENYVESQANNNIYAKGVEKSGFSTKFSKVIQVVLHNKKVDSSL